ncbi:hypothetical protein F5J12DRAFT_784543 [Pisolithus orientalis]|uniref:uncharacterized protein n=1 Tax=Pisolithus orientalis TaxID=936130 RepID=UPI002225806D|nr:uncharacterized protein F5J12DRAFT_784543 [Pisolithus orientalis]KAI5999764.1 hypothetical protein F5J12DRAFT_784543 [Pisolithus orientalis]
MFMWFRGGSIRHKVSREWDSFLQSDCQTAGEEVSGTCKEADTAQGAEEDNEMSGEEEDDDTDLDEDEGSSSEPDDDKSDDNDSKMVAGLNDNKNLKPCHDVAIQTDSKETKEQAMQASDPSLTQANDTTLTVKCEPTLQDVENVKFRPACVVDAKYTINRTHRGARYHETDSRHVSGTATRKYIPYREIAEFDNFGDAQRHFKLPTSGRKAERLTFQSARLRLLVMCKYSFRKAARLLDDADSLTAARDDDVTDEDNQAVCDLFKAITAAKGIGARLVLSSLFSCCGENNAKIDKATILSGALQRSPKEL